LEAAASTCSNGRYNEAISELSTAASLDPKLTEAHNLLGVAYDKKGFGDRAKESFERAVKMEEDADTLNNLGFSFYQNGNYRAAVDRLEARCEAGADDERILNNLGLAYCRLGKIDEAYKAFARATGPLTGNLNTAKMLERFGREDDAIRYYEARVRSIRSTRSRSGVWPISTSASAVRGIRSCSRTRTRSNSQQRWQISCKGGPPVTALVK
jgi:Flp pilus assembly protein TadD